ncbi:MAG: polysaccharide biosynthesis protein [Clostridiales bacterium]|nr:polysaccharide biosynthesis protein [Clostridiales bacterium]
MERKRKFEFLDKVWLKNAVVVCLADIVAVYAAYFFALYIRFEMSFEAIPDIYLDGYFFLMPLWCFLTVAVFYLFKLYHSIWDYVSINEAFTMVKAYFFLSILCVCSSLLIGYRMPRSFYIFGLMMAIVLHMGIRFSYRALRILKNNVSGLRGGANQAKNVMIIGAGSAGRMLIREFKGSDKLNQKVVCAIDDNPGKIGRMIEGVRVVGTRKYIIDAVSEYKVDIIVLAIPSASNADKKAILDICKETGCQLKTLPGVYQLVNGEVSVNRLREVSIHDLLGREPITIDNEEVYRMISGKTVLVTGGGGSIGSELCRQIAAHRPARLVIFDIYENNAYDIQQELIRKYGDDLNLVTLIGSVRNTHRIKSVMEKYRPDIVFHAAAHKHVPLMEESPNEAVKNNVMGTYKTALAAAEAGVSKFVLISTDKAVNPTNIMGASKRICEMIVQMMDRKYKDTSYVAVRFGNVLGSNGSVIPLFKKQIEEGGPVTVTHKDIVRYFMTIPEAVSLVLQASHYAKGGEIFVLDMGDPVRVDDMARNLIKLSGYKPDIDIKVQYIGLRPGEKLYEEKLMDEEGMEKTANKLIYIGKPIMMDDDVFMEKLRKLDEDSREDDEEIKKYVQDIVPTYHER